MESVLLGVAALACPVGMGLMMWVMAKGMRSSPARHSPQPASLEELHAEHRRLGSEIERLERDSSSSSLTESQR